MLESLVTIVDTTVPEPQASLLAGMLFGVRRDMPTELYDALLRTGTIHVVALSGMNISIIIRMLYGSVGMVFGRMFGTVITIVGIVGFVLLVGAGPSIVRAAVMGSMAILSQLIGRKDIPLLSLVFTAGTMILIHPPMLESVSFQLSVAATAGIILFSPSVQYNAISETGVSSVLRALVRFLKEDLRVSLAAQVFTVPIIWWYFQRVSLVSPLANVAIGWLVAPITYLGLGMVGLGLVSAHLAQVGAYVLWPVLTLFIELVNLFSQVPMASVEW